MAVESVKSIVRLSLADASIVVELLIVGSTRHLNVRLGLLSGSVGVTVCGARCVAVSAGSVLLGLSGKTNLLTLLSQLGVSSNLTPSMLDRSLELLSDTTHLAGFHTLGLILGYDGLGGVSSASAQGVILRVNAAVSKTSALSETSLWVSVHRCVEVARLVVVVVRVAVHFCVSIF